LKYALLFFMLAPALAFADGRDFQGFLGGGLTFGQDSLSLGADTATSKYTDQGYLIEGGLTAPLTPMFGMQVSAEVGTSNSTNTLASTSYMETGSLSYYSAKAGFYYSSFGIGGGYRHNDVEIKSLSNPGSYLQSDYSGWTSLGYANLTLDVRKRYRGVIEGQYITGTLKSNGTAGDAKFGEMSISLRFYVMFD